MKTKKFLLAAFTLALVGVSGLGAVTPVLAYQGNPAITGPNCTAERHETLEKAFERNDYSAWKNLMQDKGRVSQLITQENFARFAEAHRLAEQGKYAEANAIRQELGLGRGQKTGIGFGQRIGYGRIAR